MFELLVHIARGELSGRPLEAHGGTGNLSDCRKAYFDLDPKVQPRFRLVYRLQPDEKSPARVQAVAVGYRANLDVYVRAARNLGKRGVTQCQALRHTLFWLANLRWLLRAAPQVAREWRRRRRT